MLEQHIQNIIAENGGAIPFEEFMALCLYTPNLGYYSGANTIFGEQGDFVTAPTISPLFGATIANQIVDCYQSHYDILEFGAGNGQLAIDILRQLDKVNALPDNYYILELSGHLKQSQIDKLKTEPKLFERCRWLDKLPDSPINGIVLANEVLDAMPVEIFRINAKSDIESCYVDYKDQAFTASWQENNDPKLLNAISDLGDLPIGYQSEINHSILPWLTAIFEVLHSGIILLFDYGFSQREYYHPDRSSGTLMCHYQHKAHPDPFIHIGKQDITAHVNFTAVAEAGFQLGFNIAGYTNQAGFLIANGIAEFSSQITDVKQQLIANNAIKRLTMPQEMGELFKVMALTKQSSCEDLKGFSLLDFRHKL